MDSSDSKAIELHQGIEALKECLGDAAIYLQKISATPDSQATFQLPLPKDYVGTDRVLTISFPQSFPQSSLKLSIEPSTWLHWPHAVPSHLCLYAAGQRPPYGDAITIVHETIDRFKELIRLVLPEADPAERKRHFDSEVQTYWSHQLLFAKHQVILLNRPDMASPMLVMNRPVTSLDEEEPYYLIASDERVINAHQRKLYRKSTNARALANAAFYVKLESTPSAAIPPVKDFLSWIGSHVSDKDREQLDTWWKETAGFTVRWILAELPLSEPPAVQTFVLRDRGLKEHSIKMYGSRSGRRHPTPHASTGTYLLQSTRCHLLIEEVVYSRFMSSDTCELREKKVALIGVGSLGSPLAANLLRTGIGTLTLIDSDTFQDANLGRHILGVDALGQSKAKALAHKLQRDFPLAKVNYFDDFLGSTNKEMIAALMDVHLVVNTTANWFAEKVMWHVKPIAKWGCIQAWTEPQGLVAHALFASPSDTVTPYHLFDADGRFLHKFSQWPGDGLHRLPACGESFIAGGPIALSSSAVMVANMTVEVLLNSDESTRWDTQVASVEIVTKAGGEYIGEQLPSGVKQLTLSRKWPEK